MYVIYVFCVGGCTSIKKLLTHNPVVLQNAMDVRKDRLYIPRAIQRSTLYPPPYPLFSLHPHLLELDFDTFHFKNYLRVSMKLNFLFSSVSSQVVQNSKMEKADILDMTLRYVKDIQQKKREGNLNFLSS